MRPLDLNGDVGEGLGNDSALIPLLTSANIACGAHAGDTDTMRACLRIARDAGTAIGAHPGFRDREHVGRRVIDLSPDAIRTLVTEQVDALRALASEEGLPLHHVKPHGALYTEAARRADWAAAIVLALCESAPGAWLYAPPGSALEVAAKAAGVPVAPEGFADRGYEPDGRLTPRDRPGAMLADGAPVEARVRDLLARGGVTARGGAWVPLAIRTLCVHGDGAEALAIARTVRAAVARAGAILQAP